MKELQEITVQPGIINAIAVVLISMLVQSQAGDICHAAIQVCSYLGAACTAVIGLLRCSTDLLNTQFILPVQGSFFCLFLFWC